MANCKHIFDGSLDCSIIEGVIDHLWRVHIIQQCLTNCASSNIGIFRLSIFAKTIGKRKKSKGGAHQTGRN